MFEQSKEYPEARAVMDAVARSGKYLMGAMNNEPFELNEYRIKKFDLRRDFLVFFSSCYVHSRKPEEHIYLLALQITQRPAAECIFIDDRPLNLENPRRMGMNVILYQNAAQLRSELQKYDVAV
jgi:putative hydrolase of the HAD superfamily